MVEDKSKQPGKDIRRTLRENWLFGLVVVALVIAALLLRTRASAVESIEAVDAILTGGQPTLIELYSNT